MIMDLIGKDCEDIIYQFLHKIYMDDLIRELPIYLNDCHISRIEENNKYISAMMDNTKKVGNYRPKNYDNAVSKKWRHEMWVQSLIKQGIPDAYKMHDTY